ncbi:hypothetical protein KJ870_06320 [bacterium]|nr:hypothetical protein [bacterium]MBU1434531.1 hypothetical protein [bacterium]MBU1502109.1 hypothetical protein [bacterium]
MDVSSSTQNSSTQGSSEAPQTDTMKKATEVQERQILKILESAKEQTDLMNAQKTGMGNSINIIA